MGIALPGSLQTLEIVGPLQSREDRPTQQVLTEDCSLMASGVGTLLDKALFWRRSCH